MTGKMPRSHQSPPPWLDDVHREFMERTQRKAATNMRRDEWGVFQASLLNAYTPPKWRTNAIGIPLIKWTGRFDE